ncbi:hypothetical protein ACKS0A_02300 [Histoplasma ohiense]
MSEVPFVNCKNSFCADGLVQAVEYTLVEVSGLVIHSRHDGIRRMHNTTDDKAAAGATCQMQCRAVFHSKMFY